MLVCEGQARLRTPQYTLTTVTSAGELERDAALVKTVTDKHGNVTRTATRSIRASSWRRSGTVPARSSLAATFESGEGEDAAFEGVAPPAEHLGDAGPYR